MKPLYLKIVRQDWHKKSFATENTWWGCYEKDSLTQSNRRGQHNNTFFTENGTLFSVSLAEHVNVC